MKVGGQWAGLEWNDPDAERSEQVQRGKPPPDRSWIEVEPRFLTPKLPSFRTLWLIVISPPVIIFGSLLIAPWAFCVASALVLTVIVLKTPPGITRRSERARLLNACTAQHAAWKRGDDRFAFFGQFPPPVKWELGYLDGCAPVDEAPTPVQHLWNDGTPMPAWVLVGPAYENAAAVGPAA